MHHCFIRSINDESCLNGAIEMITYIKADLFTEPHPLIAHGCNAQGVMGAGVAKIIKNKFPQAFNRYKEECDEYKRYKRTEWILGNVILEGTIANCITQEFYGIDTDRYVSYDAIDTCMLKLRTLIFYKLIPYIAMPKIGAGLGGGNWEVIEAIINHRMKDVDVRVYHLN